MNSDESRTPNPQRMGAKIDLEKHGYSEGDFEWVGTEGSPLGGTVYVIYRPTGFRRMYQSANWEAEFEEDLKNDIFRSGS